MYSGDVEMESVTLEVINKNIEKLYNEVELIKSILLEEYGLSGWAKKELKKARETPEEEYINLNHI